MNKHERKNIMNFMSVADELYIEKVNKTEKQIKDIVSQIEKINDTLDNIQQKIDENPQIKITIDKNDIKQEINEVSDTITSLYKDYTQAKYEQGKEQAQDSNNKEVKRTAKRYKEKNNKKFSWIKEAIFYMLLIIFVAGAFLLRSNQSGKPTAIAGYSFFTVLTGSMHNEIPQGSLVISQNVDPKSLKIGDDITFMANQSTVVTHRIISIVESYGNTGARAFETKGTMNKNPDKNLVPAVNVIGKVVYHNKFLGDAATYLGQNWMFLVFVLVVIFTLGIVLKNILKDKEVETVSKIVKRKNILQQIVKQKK